MPINQNEIGIPHQPGIKKKPNKKLIFSIIVIIVIIAAFFINNYLTNHQTLYLVNPFPIESHIQIPEIGEFTVPSSTIQNITIPEGTYTISIKVGNVISKTIDINITNGIMDRLSRDNAFILNIGGGAAILWASTIYSENPDPNATGTYHIYTDTEFLTIRDIDYFFEEFPETIKIKSGSRIKKTRVDTIKGKPEDTLYALQTNNIPIKNIIDYIEKHLLVDPTNEILLKEYVNLCFGKKISKQGIKFLQKYLSKRPILIEWHRYYQILASESGKEKKLIAEYDTLLNKTPRDSALLYLRGRISSGQPEALDFFDRSIKADPKNPYPWYAKGYAYAMSGNFKKAREPVSRACELKPQSKDMNNFRSEIRFALEEYKELEKETKMKYEKNPLDIDAIDRLIQIYVVQKKFDKAKKVKNRLFTAIKKHMPNDPYNLKTLLGLELSFRLQSFKEYMTLVNSLKNPDQKSFALFRGNLVQLKFKKAERALAMKKTEKGFNPLLMWLGWKTIARNEKKARPWFYKALEKFMNGSFEGRTIAKILVKSQKDILKKVDVLKLSFSNKAIICAALAELNQKNRKELLNRAEKMNFGLHFPHFFLKKVIKNMKKH